MEPDLFTAAAEERAEKEPGRSPLAVRMRPRTLDEVVGQRHLLGAGSPLRRLVAESGGGPAGPSSVILWGPPGTGKTTLAYVVSHATNRRFVELSAITAVVVGGTPLTGGQARIAGTVAGAVLIQLLTATLIKHDLPPSWTQIAQAIVIVLAVYAARGRGKR